MKNYPYKIGIDVSKLTLDFTLLQSDKTSILLQSIVDNSAKCISSLLAIIRKQKINLQDVLFCFEDTGVYSLPLCYNLFAKGLDYWMVSALEIKRSKGIVRGKSDRSDAKDIAYYAHTHLHKLKLGKLAAQDIMTLKLLLTERDKHMKAIQVFAATAENEGYMPQEILKKVKARNAKTIKQLQATIKELEKDMEALIMQNETLQEQFKLVTSVPGIGPQTGYYLIAVTKGFSTFENSRQLACYAGVAPFPFSSGTSIKGRTKVSHLADKKLKSLLTMCALNAKKYDKQIGHYYEEKVAAGKPKLLVLNNIKSKLLSRVMATVNRGTPFVNTLEYMA